MLDEKVMKGINERLKQKIGVTYEEFILLSDEKQQELLNTIKSNKKESNLTPTMIGSGMDSIFIKVKEGTRVMLEDGTFVEAGITSEEVKIKVNNKIKKIVKSNKK